MGRALVPVLVLDHHLAVFQRSVEVAEFEVHVLRDVAVLGPLVHLPLRMLERLVDAGHRRQDLVLDPDLTQRLLGLKLGVGRHRRDRVPDVARLLFAQRLFVLCPRNDSVVLGKILAGDHRVDPGHRERRCRVDP